MKVYLAAYGYDYEGPDYVIGIFSSRELAEKALSLYQSYGDWRQVDEFALDQTEDP